MRKLENMVIFVYFLIFLQKVGKSTPLEKMITHKLNDMITTLCYRAVLDQKTWRPALTDPTVRRI